MLSIQRAAPSSKGIVLLFRENYSQALSPSKCIIIKKFDSETFQHKSDFNKLLKRDFHVTKVSRDIETGLKALGSGIAATGVIGPGIGLGIIFGNLLAGTARNPSAGPKIFGIGIMGAAFCESVGLFALVISFLLMP